MSLSPREIATVQVTPSKFQKVLQKLPGTPIAKLDEIVEGMLKTTLEMVIKDGFEWIAKYVPFATGQLQNSLIEALRASTVDQGVFLRLMVGTDLEYAPIVAKMDERKVRHPKGGYTTTRVRRWVLKDGTVHEKKVKVRVDLNRRWVNYYHHRGYITLSDPLAVGRFWGLLILYLRQRLRVRLHEVILQKSATYGLRVKAMTDQFKVANVS